MLIMTLIDYQRGIGNLKIIRCSVRHRYGRKQSRTLNSKLGSSGSLSISPSKESFVSNVGAQLPLSSAIIAIAIPCDCSFTGVSQNEHLKIVNKLKGSSL